MTVNDVYAGIADRVKKALEKLEDGGISEESAVNVARELEIDLAKWRKGLRPADAGGESDPALREGLRSTLAEFVLRFRRAVR